MARVYERKHAHLGGAMVASVTETEEGQYAVYVRCYHPDGRVLVIVVGTPSDYQSVLDAQRTADAHVENLLEHECSELCEQWPGAVTH